MSKCGVLDTNLLVLLVVGLTDPAYITKHKRLQAYDLDSLKQLHELIAASEDVLVTPNTLSEASNILRQIGEPARSAIGQTFRTFVRLKKEIYITSEAACLRDEFLRLGLSDSALLEVAKSNIVILSADLDLYIAAQAAGYDAINFNHVRDYYYEQARHGH